MAGFGNEGLQQGQLARCELQYQALMVNRATLFFIAEVPYYLCAGVRFGAG